MPRPPFPDPASLPITAPLEAAFPVIQAEAARLFEVPYWSGWRPYGEGDSYAGQGRWEVFALYGGGRRNEAVLARCPATARILAQVPHLRQALFSTLGPRTRILPHRGSPGILRVHLVLFAEPGQAGWRVDGEVRACVEGRVVAFEDGGLHEAWNDGATHRVTLLFDTPAPDLEPDALQAVLAAYDQQMEAGRDRIR
jgi:beta-hydroxylase